MDNLYHVHAYNNKNNNDKISSLVTCSSTFATNDNKRRVSSAVHLYTPKATNGLVRRETNGVLPSHNQFVRRSQAFCNLFFFFVVEISTYLRVIRESDTNPCFDAKPHPMMTVMCMLENTLASKIFSGSI